MLRIGQFTDTFLPIVDGVGRVVQAYSETLCKMGHQVTVVAPMYDTGFQGGFPFELVDYVGNTVPGLKQYKVGEAILDAHYRKRIRMIDLDVIHAHSPFTAGSEALRLAAVRKLPEQVAPALLPGAVHFDAVQFQIHVHPSNALSPHFTVL